MRTSIHASIHLIHRSLLASVSVKTFCVVSRRYPNSLPNLTNQTLVLGIASLLSCSASIAPSITKIFNASVVTGMIPSQWKRSLIVPIPKDSNASGPSNYRPIYLLPIISKTSLSDMYILLFWSTFKPT